MTDEDSGKKSFELRDIRELRLYLTPSRFWENYMCELCLADGGKLRISDEYAQFFVRKVSSRETYRSFISALSASLALANPHCRFRAGPRGLSYLMIVLTMAAAIYLITQFLVVEVGMSETDSYWFFASGCGLILLKSPYWRRANRLAEFDPTAIPAELLPRQSDLVGARS